ncbi:MAG: ABC transporter substrate-binding protein [Anaerolineae bacterium]|jgi:ABC-type branched-subunit amino acid transport system substrate-binding protein|nr:ABC transporter substrate-binding protein [Anaerolineae bacterium]
MRKLLIVLLLALSLMPVIAQEEPLTLAEFMQRTECEADLTGQTLPLYHFGDISAAYAPITQPLLAGIGDALEYFNARGGICGATVEQVNRDTANDLAQAQAVYDDFSTRDPKPFFLVMYSSPDSELLREQLAEDEIPVVISAGSVEGLYGPEGNEPGWIFATNPLYADQMAHFCEYVGANPDSFPESPTMGYISWPGSFGEAAYTPEAIAHCAEQGVTVIDGPELFLPTAPDVITQVQNLIDKGANMLYTNTLASGGPVIARALVDLGLEGEIVLAGDVWTMDSSAGLIDQQTRNAAGLPAVNGMYGSMPFRWWTELQVPGIAFLNEQFALQAEAKGRDATTQARLRNISYLLGWQTVDLYIELTTQTINRVGIEGLNGAAMKETMETTVYEPLGLQLFDFKGGEIRDLEQNRIVQYAFLNAEGNGPATSGDDAMLLGGQFFVPIVVPLTDFQITPDMRPGMMMDPQATEEAAP